MMENKLKPLVSGLILIMAFLFAPLASGRDPGYGYRAPPPVYRSYGGDKSYGGYHKPPYDYHGRAYSPHDPQATHENTVPDGHGYHQGYDSGYHDGYRDAPKP